MQVVAYLIHVNIRDIGNGDILEAALTLELLVTNHTLSFITETRIEDSVGSDFVRTLVDIVLQLPFLGHDPLLVHTLNSGNA